MSFAAVESLEILQLVARADNCATARDGDAYAELFTEDCVMTGAMGSARGRAALRGAVDAVWAAEPAHTLHLTLNVTIDESGPDPIVTSIMLMVTRDATPDVFGLRWSARSRGVPRRGGGSLQETSKIHDVRLTVSRPFPGSPSIASRLRTELCQQEPGAQNAAKKGRKYGHD